MVPMSLEASTAIAELSLETEAEYEKAEEAGDETARTAWSRTCEHASKLALIYACSENHLSPVIGMDAVRWASEFAMHQPRRQLYLAALHVAENPFHAQCLKMRKKLSEQPDHKMQRRKLMRSMRLKLNDFEQVLTMRCQQEEIEMVSIQTKTKTAQGYRLIN